MSSNSGSSSLSPEIVSEFRSYYIEPESTCALIYMMSFNKFKFLSLVVTKYYSTNFMSIFLSVNLEYLH